MVDRTDGSNTRSTLADSSAISHAVSIAIRGSRVITILEAVGHNARARFEPVPGATILTRASDASTVRAIFARTTNQGQDLLAATVTLRFLRTLVAWGKASFLYRWLTAEPEPSVIVIDLRKTRSIGPFLAWIDRVITCLLPTAARSRVANYLTYVSRSVRRAPVRTGSIIVSVATAVDLAVGLQTTTQSGVVARVVLLVLAAIGTRITITWEELSETKPVQLLITVLEPPPPPESTPPQEDVDSRDPKA